MVNKVTLLGRIGKDPETKATPSGKLVATFSIATRAGKNKTDWHNIVAWEKNAESAQQYYHKGDLVYIEGRIQYRSWEDNDGQTKHITEIVAYSMWNCSPITQKEQPQPQTQEELPF